MFKRSDVSVVVVIAGSLLSGCGRAAMSQSSPSQVCTGSIGLSVQLQGLVTGHQSVPIAVFRTQGKEFAQEHEPGTDVRARFFRRVDENPEFLEKGKELRLMLPKSTVAYDPKGQSLGMLNPSLRYNYKADVAFDKPGNWGLEIFVVVPWQTAPAQTTLSFHVDSPSKGTEPPPAAQPATSVLVIPPCVTRSGWPAESVTASR